MLAILAIEEFVHGRWWTLLEDEYTVERATRLMKEHAGMGNPVRVVSVTDGKVIASMGKAEA